MKILITGGTGYVGQYLGRALTNKAGKASSHEIYVLTRSPEKNKHSMTFPCQLVKEPPAELDAVVHLAGEPIAQRWTEKAKKRFFDSRIGMTKKLENFQSVQNAKVWISASAIGFYGMRGEEELTESSAIGKGYLPELTRDWEESWINSKLLPKRRVGFRIGLVLGTDSAALKTMQGIFQEGLGGALGNGKQWMSWIHVEDLVSMIMNSLENTEMDGLYNAVSPYPVRNNEFTKLLCKTLKVRPFLNVPSFSLKLLYGKMSQLLIGSQKVLPKKLSEEGFRFRFEKLEQALENSFFDIKPSQRFYFTQQWISGDKSKIFDFFQDEKNLETITPPLLNFKVLKKSTDVLEQGTHIDYKLKIKGVPVKWKTEIKTWNPPESFSDFQLKGPYKLWDHTHEFNDHSGGVLCTDIVRYELPLGKLGRLVALSMVSKDVKSIFEYRRKVIGEKFL